MAWRRNAVRRTERADGLRLDFRHAPGLGPNAFVLPTGPFTTTERPFRRTTEGQPVWSARDLSRFEVCMKPLVATAPDAASLRRVADTVRARVTLANTGHFGYTVRVVPRNNHLASVAEMGLVAVPPS